MEILAELEPSKDPDEFIERARILAGIYDWIDIPDSPLGIPSINSLLASCSLSINVTNRIISHIRLIDLNRIAFNSIIKTLALVPLKRIVFLRGDPPRKNASIINDVDPEYALSYAKTRIRDKEFGLLLSMRKSWNEISERLSLQPDFTLILNIRSTNSNMLNMLRNEAKTRRIKTYAYIVIETSRNSHLLRGSVNRLSLFNEKEAQDYIQKLSAFLDGFLISVPGDFNYLVELGRKLSRR